MKPYAKKIKKGVAIILLVLFVAAGGYEYSIWTSDKDGVIVVASSVPNNDEQIIPATIAPAPPAAEPSSMLPSYQVKSDRHTAAAPLHFKQEAIGGSPLPVDGEVAEAVVNTVALPEVMITTSVSGGTLSSAVKKNSLIVHTATSSININGGLSPNPRTTDIGIEAGTNNSGWYNNKTANKMHNGFHAGMMLNIALGDRFALQPAIIYITKGNEEKSIKTVEGLDENITRKVTAGYLQLPVNVVYKFGDRKGAPRFMVGGGGYVALLTNNKNTIQETIVNAAGFTTWNNKYNYKLDLRKADAGISGFLGCQLPGGFFARGGAEMGLLNVQQYTPTGTFADRNYDFFISLGYIIGGRHSVY